MTTVRAIAGAGLVLLLVIAGFALFISIREENWGGVLVGVCFVSLIAFLFDALRVEASRCKPGARAPSRTILLFFLLCCGVVLSVAGVTDLMFGRWWAGAVKLLMAATMLAAVFGNGTGPPKVTGAIALVLLILALQARRRESPARAGGRARASFVESGIGK